MPFRYVPSLVTPLLWGLCTGIGEWRAGEAKNFGHCASIIRWAGSLRRCGGSNSHQQWLLMVSVERDTTRAWAHT